MKLNLILIAAISSAVSATRYGLLRVSNAEGGHTNKSAARRALSFDEDFRVCVSLRAHINLSCLSLNPCSNTNFCDYL